MIIIVIIIMANSFAHASFACWDSGGYDEGQGTPEYEGGGMVCSAQADLAQLVTPLLPPLLLTQPVPQRAPLA